MPIDYKEYHPDWKAISLRIRNERAGNKCEWCGRANHSYIVRNEDGTEESGLRWVLPYWRHDEENERNGLAEIWNNPWDIVKDLRDFHGIDITYVVLTVSHLDHDKTNNEDSNLAALCQRCHLNHDRKQHAENRRNGRNWKRDQTKLDL